MRPVSEKMTDGWKREDKTGEYRPCVRATITRTRLKRFPYDTAKADGGDWEHQRKRKGSYTSIIFGEENRPLELRGIKSCTWERSLDQDVATCTIVLKNSELIPMGALDEDEDDWDKPGHFTHSRGVTWEGVGWRAVSNAEASAASPWGYHAQPPWRNLMIPDRVVKTFEGYGSDYSVYPAEDENLMQTGTWLIDKVTYTADGEITLEMRDVGRMLLTHICFPPAVPYGEYPLSFSKIQSAQVPGRDAKGGKWTSLKGIATARSSNTAYIGEGLTDPPYPYYVSAKGHVNGHHPNHALDPRPIKNKYWMSTGQTTRNSYVWWSAKFNSPKSVAGLKIDPVGGPYRIFISIRTADGWLGRKKIPYSVTTEGIDNGSKIPFVQSVWADRWSEFDVIFKRKYRNVREIRLTFTKLNDNWVGNYPFRAMLRDVKAYIGSYDDLHFAKGYKTKVVGNYRDYTHIVKTICAWGGFYWPGASTGQNFWTINEDERKYVPWEHHDAYMVSGRTWGVFQKTHTAGVADLTVDLFDKKPFMDVINYVRDIVGFIFQVDEWGGIVWRMPNLYQAGNYVAPEPVNLATRARRYRSTALVTLDEKETLLNYQTTLSSENIREVIFIANATGRTGVATRGFNPSYEGFRRTAGWTDMNFKNKQEAIVMADMIAAQQMFDYRRTSVTTPGYPAIQCDDQIRIFERVTNETYYHYVIGIKSENNMETGEWTYDLNTHWLGDSRSDAWMIDVHELDSKTRNYLNLLKGSQDMSD